VAEGAQAAIVVTGKPRISKYWLQDASFACAYIWLEAVEVGLGSAFGAVYNAEDEQGSVKRESYARNLLGIPEECRVVAALGLGYPNETPKPKKNVPREVVYVEKFSGIENLREGSSPLIESVNFLTMKCHNSQTITFNRLCLKGKSQRHHYYRGWRFVI
jgi:hypothetical protein